MNLLKLENNKITSLQILEEINFFRKQNSKDRVRNTEMQHKTLLGIIRDEFEEEIAEQRILLGSYLDKNNQSRPMFELTINQAKQLLVRESKVVRKAVIKRLEELENKIAIPSYQIENPVDRAKGITYGVGVNDFEGRVTYIENGKNIRLKSYNTWNKMLERCYSEKFKKKCSCYKGCYVSSEWLLYSNFKKWFDENYPFELSETIKFDLDKDLLVEGNKIYSEETCLFLPHRINSFLTNIKSNNSTGFTGVDFFNKNGKFRSRIINFKTGKSDFLGYSSTAVEASEKYNIARKYMSMLAKQYATDLGLYDIKVINKIK